MRAKLIVINWLLALMGVSGIDWDRTGALVFLLVIGWFLAASLVLLYADRRGWMKGFNKQYKLDEL
jgi:hypothetical protein